MSDLQEEQKQEGENEKVRKIMKFLRNNNLEATIQVADIIKSHEIEMLTKAMKLNLEGDATPWFFRNIELGKRKEIQFAVALNLTFVNDSFELFENSIYYSFPDFYEEATKLFRMFSLYVENLVKLDHLLRQGDTHVAYDHENNPCRECKQITKYPMPIQVALIPPFELCTTECKCFIKKVER